MNPTNIITVQQSQPKTVKILNISIDNISKTEILSKLKHGGVVFTPNVDHIIKLQKIAVFTISTKKQIIAYAIARC